MRHYVTRPNRNEVATANRRSRRESISVAPSNLLNEREAHISFHLNKAAGAMSSRPALACEKLFGLNHSAIEKCNPILQGAGHLYFNLVIGAIS
jgi:hypothetical protein